MNFTCKMFVSVKARGHHSWSDTLNEAIRLLRSLMDPTVSFMSGSPCRSSDSGLSLI